MNVKIVKIVFITNKLDVVISSSLQKADLSIIQFIICNGWIEDIKKILTKLKIHIDLYYGYNRYIGTLIYQETIVAVLR